MLDEQQTRATFFTLGWIAERYPHLVRASSMPVTNWQATATVISAPAISERSRFFCRRGTRQEAARGSLGPAGQGYRAPSFSIGEAISGLSTVSEAGYCYSSSIYPIRHDHYGMPARRASPIGCAAGLLELPVTTARFLIATGRPAAAATSACCPMRCRAGCCRRSTSSMVSRRSSISIPGKSMPRSRALPVSVPRRVFATMSICSIPKAESEALLADFNWGRMDEVFLGAGIGGGGETMRSTIEEVTRLAAASAPLVVKRLNHDDPVTVARWDAFVRSVSGSHFFPQIGMAADPA
jgi:hypothetical protein